LGHLVVPPGHVVLRSDDFQGLIEHVAKGSHPAYDKPIRLNPVTDSKGPVKFFDSWDGHHRLVARMASGQISIGDIPIGEIEILINGRKADGTLLNHRPHMSGVNLSLLDHVEIAQSKQAGTLIFPGETSNYQL